MTGVDLIKKERKEQLDKHGFTVESDAKNNASGELITSAVALLHTNVSPLDFPSNWDSKRCEIMAKKSYENRLVIAAALIAAERDRLEFLKPKKK